MADDGPEYWAEKNSEAAPRRVCVPFAKSAMSKASE